MALYDPFDRQDLRPATAVAAEPSQGRFLAIPGTGSLADVVGLALVGMLLLVWTVGAYAGIVYWSIQGSLWGVILSVIVPGFGATSTVPLYLWLGASG